MNHSSILYIKFGIVHNNKKLHLIGNDFNVVCKRNDLLFTNTSKQIYFIKDKNNLGYRIIENDLYLDFNIDITNLDTICKHCLNKIGYY
jgi:hypothetical protein